MPAWNIYDVDGEGNAGGAGNGGGMIESWFADWVGERDEGVAEQVQGRGFWVEPNVRGPMSWPGHRQVLTDRVPGPRRRSVVVDDRSGFEGVSQHQPVDRIRRSRGAKACVSAGDRMCAAFRLVGLQQRGARPPCDHTRKLPCQVVRVGEATVHAEAALGCGQMRGIPGQEDPADPVVVGDQSGGVPEPVAEVPQFHAVVAEASGGAGGVASPRMPPSHAQ